MTTMTGLATPAARPLAGRLTVAAYGLLAYGAFFAVFLYLIAFTGGFLPVKHAGSGEVGAGGPPLWLAALINVGLVALFGAQHAVMARPRFKVWLTRFVPAAAERATFVLAASLCLAVMYIAWAPMPRVIWDVETPAVRVVLWSVFASGWALVLGSSFVISHFDLFGLRQVVLNLLQKPYTHMNFQVVGPYRLVRHPLMLGFLLSFWAAPTMTAGRLLFAAAMTGYILIGTAMEERDLVRAFGERYLGYRRQVPSLLPSPVRRWRGEETPLERQAGGMPATLGMRVAAK